MVLVGTVLSPVSPASMGGLVNLGPHRRPSAPSRGFWEPGSTRPFYKTVELRLETTVTNYLKSETGIISPINSLR